MNFSNSNVYYTEIKSIINNERIGHPRTGYSLCIRRSTEIPPLSLSVYALVYNGTFKCFITYKAEIIKHPFPLHYAHNVNERGYYDHTQSLIRLKTVVYILQLMQRVHVGVRVKTF